MNRVLYILILTVTLFSFSQENKVKHELINLDINNEYPSFGASFYGDGKIVFASTKTGRKLNLFIADINGENVSEQSVFFKSTKSNVHETNVTFTNDRKTMYFTRSIKGKDNTTNSRKNKQATIAIFKATLKNGIWGDVVPMPFNSNDYDVAHPALNTDNTILYFTSNMPGTIGDNDIFQVTIDKENGKYSDPKNLGPKINTKRKEMFPFVSSENLLYFSSNGHKDNFGGLDIYYAKIYKNATSSSYHIKDPVNSRWDDFSYIYNPNTKTGFLSSNRPGGKGDDDIYFVKEKEIKEEKEEIIDNCINVLTGIVHYDNNLDHVIASSNIIIKDNNEKDVMAKTTRSSGKFRFNLKCNKNYKIVAFREGYLSGTESIRMGSENYGKTIKNINLEATKEKRIYQTASGVISFSFNDTNLLDYDMYQLEKAAILMRQNANLKIIIESHTDSRGDDEVNMKLSETRVEIVRDYFLKSGFGDERVIGKAFGETKLLNKCKNKVECSAKEHLKNRRTTYILTE